MHVKKSLLFFFDNEITADIIHNVNIFFVLNRKEDYLSILFQIYQVLN